MMWEEILKATPPNPRNPHGIHVTKMYMFLKRYFADSHTDQFKNTYILWHEFDYESDRERVHETIKDIINGTHSYRMWGASNFDIPIPGIRIIHFDSDDSEVHIEFNDAEHIKGRDEHIANSIESNKDNFSQRYRYAYKDAPHDLKLQRGWDILIESIKKTKNRNYRRSKRYL